MNIVTAFDSPAAISKSLLAGHKVNVCPLWVISGHLQCKTHVRFTPKSGHELLALANVRLVPQADILAREAIEVVKFR